MFIAALGAGGAEIPLAAPVYGPAEFIQFHPQVASDGDNFLVVWSDLRGSAYTNLYAARVTASGEVLDKTNIRVADQITTATVLWTGRAYLILITNSAGGLSVARLDRDGRLVAPAQPLNITGIIYTDPQQLAASNGSRVVIGYGRQDGFNAFKRFVAVLDAEGQLLESEIPIPSEDGGSPKPLVASNGSEFLVVTQALVGDAATVSALRLDASGHPVDSALTRIADGRFSTVASNGSDYLILMAAPHAGSAAENMLLTRRVARDGSLGALVTIPLAGRPDDITSLAWLGSEYVGTFTAIADAAVVEGLRLNADGATIGQPFAISQPGAGPSIVSNGRRAFTAWVDGNPAGNSDILGRLLAPTPTGETLMLDTAAAAQRRPAGAYDGTTFLTAWEETQNDSGQPRVYIGRVSPSGARLDGRGIRVSSSDAVQRDPHVVYDGTRFVVGWEEGDAILLRRVARSGAFIDTAPIAVPNACRSGEFDMATDAGTTVITWIDCTSRDVMAIRYDDASNSFRDAQPLVIAEPENGAGIRPRIAFGFDIALVVWEERIEVPGSIPEPTFQGNVRGVSFYVPQMLILEDPFDIAATTEDERSPAVAWDNQEFLVAYADASGINGRYVDPFGFLLTETRVADGAGLDHPSMQWDGVEFVVAFSGGGDVYASRVRRRSDSTVLSGKFAVAASGDFEGNPAVVLMGTGRVGFLYDRVATEPLYGGVPRVFLRLLENVAPRPRPKR
jgi:hypothetical protein